MGVMETKIIQVENDPRVINAANEEWGRWGWSVLSVQVTHSQNTKTYTSTWQQMTGSNEHTVETTTINYTTITYQRDKGMPNYEQIAALEEEYNSVESRIRKSNSERIPEIIEFKFGGVEILKTVFLLWMWIIPGIIYIVKNVKQYKASISPENQENIRIRKEIREQEKIQIQQEKNRILKEAAALLRSA